MIGTLLLCIIAGLVFILLKRWFSIQDYWKDRDVSYRKPLPLVGNMRDYLLKRKSVAEIIKEIGCQFSQEPLVGLFNFMKPTIIVNDPEYAEIVMIKEFSHFMNRAEEININDRRPLDKHLFFISGSDWKAVRSKLTPVFTTGKLRGMLPEIEGIFDKTLKEFDLLTTKMDLKDIIEKCTLRVRASCVFGIDLSESESEAEFIKKVHDISDLNIMNIVPRTIALWLPKVAQVLDLSIFGADNERYFVDVLLKSFKERTDKKIVKHDFVQTLLELKHTGKVEVKHWSQDDEYLKSHDQQPSTDTVEINDDILISQSFIFLIAGLETLINTLTMLLVELARNPKVLETLTKEIDSVIGQNKEFSFQSLKDLEYLELCIKEALRMHTPAEFLVRHCNKTYTFPNGVTIEKGTDVFFPTMKFLLDPAIFPDPLEFKPERFRDESHPLCAYLPFGQGPRICIGLRFAMMEMKMFISKLIYNYEFSLDSSTELPVRKDKWFFLRKNISPIHMNFKPRSH